MRFPASRIIPFFLFIMLSCFAARSQSPFLWARAATGNGEGLITACDPSGKVFIGGNFNSTSLTFGSFTLSNPTSPNNQFYIAEYTSTGTVLWARTISGANQSSVTGLAADDSGNVYVSGSFSGGTSITFSPLTITNNNSSKAFLAKYNSSGNVVWVSYEGSSGSGAQSVTIDGSGNIYLAAASFDNTITFDTITATSAYAGWEDVYLVKYNPGGHALWLRHFGSNQVTVGSCVRTDQAGDVYLFGRYKGASLVIGNDTLNNSGAPNEDVFITKFSSAGNEIWAKGFGGTGIEFAQGISLDNFGNVTLAIQLYGASIVIASTTYTNVATSSYDFVLVRLNTSNGSVNRSTHGGGTNGEAVYSLFYDANGNLFMSGGFDWPNSGSPPPGYTISFCNGSVTSLNNSTDPAFIVEIDSAWNFVRSLVLQTGGDDAIGISRNRGGPGLYVTGDAILRPWVLGNDTLTQPVINSEYPFVMKLDLANNGLFTATYGVNGTNCMNSCSASAGTATGGGTPPYSYSWSPGGQTTSSVSNLCPGVYTVTVTDATSATLTQTVNVAYTPPLPVITATPTNVSCNGSCNGSYTYTITGGHAPFSYFTGPTTGLCAGTYTIQVTDSWGCTATSMVFIGQPPPIITSVSSVTNVSCNGGNNGSATISASGGTGAFTYSWAPSGGTAATASGLIAGTYTCTVRDANLCMSTRTVSITQPSAITVSVSSFTNVSCSGGNNGAATVSASGGTGTLTYTWTPTGGNAATATGLIAGTYTCTVRDANLCTGTQTILITQPAAITSSISASTDILCNGGNNGSATISASGGAGTLTYSWLPSGGNSATANSLSAGVYTCTITDANMCTQTQTVSVTQPPAITSSVSSANILCNGGSDGVASVTSSGGTGTLTYLWSPSGGNAPTAPGLIAGTYTCTITDANLCSVSQTVQITEPASISSSVSITNVLCNGGNNGTATITANGGTGTLTYLWSPSGGNAATASGMAPATYTCTITDANMCVLTQSVSITEPSVINISLFSSTDVFCNGGSDGSATISASGGTGTLMYSWLPSGGNAATANGLSAGTYTCMVTDNNSCVNTQTMTITEPLPMSATLTVTDAGCFTCADGSISCVPSGGIPAYTFQWQPVNCSTSTATGLLPGTYTCCITDMNGCVLCVSDSVGFSTSINVTVPGKMLFYPNPVHDKLIVSLPSRACTVRVMDAQGKLVMQKVATDRLEIDCSAWSDGVYFAEVTDGMEVYKDQFVKE